MRIDSRCRRVAKNAPFRMAGRVIEKLEIPTLPEEERKGGATE